MPRVIFALLCLVCLNSCGKEQPPFQLAANAAQQLSGDSAKTWMLARRDNGGIRVNMGPCTMGYRQTFLLNGTFQDNNQDQEADCGKSLQGRWYLRHDKENTPYLTLQSKLLPEVMGTPKNIKDFQIMALSDTLLVLRFRHRLFSNKPTTIVDSLVPENTSMPDRYFHW